MLYLGFLAAIGAFRIVSEQDPAARMKWRYVGSWAPELHSIHAETLFSAVMIEDRNSYISGPVFDMRYLKLEKQG